MLRLRDQGRALTDQVVGALGARIERRAQRRENRPPLLQGVARRNQRARAPRGLDHQRAEAEPRDNPVAPQEIAPARLPAHRHLGDKRSSRRQDALDKRDVVRRVDPIVAAGQHGHGPGGERGFVRTGIDAAGQSRDDDETGVPKPARQPFRQGQAGRRSVAGADHGQGGLPQGLEIAANGDQRRGGIGGLEASRIGILADGD
ncbi:hypothetical protein MGN01_03910 [Methylobacterium gnaphalii]|uniref:Uncharacterized protein n=1 Tax=Methylobacterium gnaphalii TaxID=1010610 RepID=A0A512JF34_9HYPH|nr:hypothetical protein MGN01_03910 [Methylobacterium gnaphalii]GLS50763.1 hypothetical protein GCM10007885_36170 [Methylobacterium gnaphalii]